MCSHYQASTDLLRMAQYMPIDVENRPPFEREVYPVRPAPLVRPVKDETAKRRVELALWRSKLAPNTAARRLSRSATDWSALEARLDATRPQPLGPCNAETSVMLLGRPD